MPLKSLKWWEKEYLDAIGYACAYSVPLSFLSFCAARHLEEPEISTIRDYLESRSICCD